MSKVEVKIITREQCRRNRRLTGSQDYQSAKVARKNKIKITRLTVFFENCLHKLLLFFFWETWIFLMCLYQDT